ncbi:MAG: DNA primase [Ruminococcaceae bacterium]|nr:DNA primase [Oscillospiraceae bacterium]
MIPREIIDEIVFRNDIETVIGSYVTLKRAGSNYQAPCPFHSERTPSFTVFTATKSFYCFGCGAGGDVISFIMRAENLDYVDALKWLADKAGISIPEDNSYEEKTGVSRKRVLELNLAAAQFFRSCLFDPKIGAEAMAYLRDNRQLDMATIKHFGLGYSPNDFVALTNRMRDLGFTDEELEAAFLAKRSQKSGRLFDLYRNRVIFPIIDTSGNVIAFGGRVMDSSEPKYLNTSDTPAFKKSRQLFALNYAKKHCAERMILCEGYMDVIALHAAGFENAVATLGTAITPDQARVFAKYTKKVIICYDSDKAGQTAANKAIRLLGEVGVDVKILKLNGAKDPDEYIKKFGADSFRSCIDESRSAFEFRMNKILGEHDISIADEKIKASYEICTIIADVTNNVERDIYIQYASKLLEVPVDSVRNDVGRIRNKKLREQKNKQSKDAMLSIKNINDRVNPDSARFVAANDSEESILAMMMIFDEYRDAVVKGEIDLTADDFVTAFGRKVFETLCMLERSENGYSRAMLGQYFNLDEISRLEKIEVERRRLTRNDREVFDSCIASLKEQKQQSVPAEGQDLLSIMRQKRNAQQKKD